MIDHLPIERLRAVEDLKFWRVVQWTTWPVALGVASAVAMTAQPFISANMHMPVVGAWSVAVAIPLVSGLASHMAVEHGGWKGVGYGTAAILCAVLSGATIINSKEFNELAELTTKHDTINSTANAENAEARKLQQQILQLQQQAQTVYQESLAKCSGKFKTSCTKLATSTLDATMATLTSQYTEVVAHKAPIAAPVAAVKLSVYDYVLSAVPDVFAGILAFAFFYARRKVSNALHVIKSAVQPTTQTVVEKRGDLSTVKARLGADLRAGSLPPIAIALDGQIIVNRLAMHYKLHGATVKKMLKAAQAVEELDGRFYIKVKQATLVAIGGTKWNKNHP